MSYFDYSAAQAIVADDPPFYALIMAAMRRADTTNAALLHWCWPDIWDELQARYNAPGGILPGDPGAVTS